MAYATKADIETIYGGEFIADLLPPDIADADQAIAAALANASAEIDGYLSARYTLPLAGQPDVLKRPAIDIAAYILANRHSRLTDTMVERYKQAIDYLKLMAQGKAGLGRDEPRIEGAAGEGATGGSAFSAEPRRFGRGRAE